MKRAHLIRRSGARRRRFGEGAAWCKLELSTLTAGDNRYIPGPCLRDDVVDERERSGDRGKGRGLREGDKVKETGRRGDKVKSVDAAGTCGMKILLSPLLVFSGVSTGKPIPINSSSMFKVKLTVLNIMQLQKTKNCCSAMLSVQSKRQN